MKKNKLLIVLVMLLLLIVPSVAKAKETKYKTMDYEQTLNDEELEKKYTKYSPNKDAITIYLFRGHGCSFCRAYLEFMNSITDEYGKYFKLQSYEVWGDQDNSQFMTTISSFLGQPATGVPYIIIGDKVFPGFNEEAYGESIKAAIKTLYDTKKSDRYDVLEEYEKSLKGDEKEEGPSTLIVCVVVVISAIVVIAFVNAKFTKLEEQIESISNKRVSESKTELRSESYHTKNNKKSKKEQ